jgi:hypothetical protein
MATETLKQSIDWAYPNKGTEVTLDDYLQEMKEAESSGDMSLGQFQKDMNQWLTENISISPQISQN